MIKGENEKANKLFAFAYQMRCVADFTWKNILGKDGDTGHANYLQVSRKFSQFALGKIGSNEIKEIKTLIEKIKD